MTQQVFGVKFCGSQRVALHSKFTGAFFCTPCWYQACRLVVLFCFGAFLATRRAACSSSYFRIKRIVRSSHPSFMVSSILTNQNFCGVGCGVRDARGAKTGQDKFFPHAYRSLRGSIFCLATLPLPVSKSPSGPTLAQKG